MENPLNQNLSRGGCFDLLKIKTLPLSERISKTDINKIMINPDNPGSDFLKLDNLDNFKIIKQLSSQIKQARQNNKPVIMTFGAHLIKNGLSLVVIDLIKKGFITHLATNGAGSIHDWEVAFQGKTEEDVRHYVQQGQFGLWEETGRYLNQAVTNGAKDNLGYGEAVGKMIYEEKLNIDNLKLDKIGGVSHEQGDVHKQISESKLNESSQVESSSSPNLISNNNKGEVDSRVSETIKIPHPYKPLSIFATAYSHHVPITVHPCLGQDIIHISPYCDFQAIGKTAQTDFHRFIDAVCNLEGGVYISIGSAIMSPMIFEKALSAARNVVHQKGEGIKDFMIVVNDIQPSGDWKWGSGQEPPKDNPAYYLRFCKTFDRMGAREMHYVQDDNRGFLVNLYKELNSSEKNVPQHL